MGKFEDWRKKLGSPRAKIRFEYSQDKSIYIVSTLCVFMAGILIIATKPIKNPYLITFMLWNSILYFGISILLRKTYIKELPKDADIIKEIENDGKLDDFINYLESRLTPYNICDFLSTNRFATFNSNVIFSALFSFFCYLSNFFVKTSLISIYRLMQYYGH